MGYQSGAMGAPMGYQPMGYPPMGYQYGAMGAPMGDQPGMGAPMGAPMGTHQMGYEREGPLEGPLDFQAGGAMGSPVSQGSPVVSSRRKTRRPSMCSLRGWRGDAPCAGGKRDRLAQGVQASTRGATPKSHSMGSMVAR
jgi:hypothetical protein